MTTPYDRFIHAVDLQQALKKLSDRYWVRYAIAEDADAIVARAKAELIDELAEALELDIK